MISLVFAIIVPTKLLATVAVILAAAVVLLFVLSIRLLNLRKIAAILLFCFISVALFTVYHKLTVAPIQKLSGETHNVTATVLQSKISSKGNKYYVVKLDTINSKNVPGTAKIHLHTTNNDELKDWDKIKTTITFFENSESYSDSFYRSNVILASAISIDDIEIINKNKFSLFGEICRIRDKIIFKVRSNLTGDNGNILCGILFGKRDNISTEATETFASAGISHLLAVSGLHLSIIVMLLNLLLSRLYVGKTARSIICIIITAILSVMIGFTPSIIRSAVMLLFLLTAQCIREDYDSPSILAFSAVLICIAEPYSITNIGFLLSFSATAGLLVSQSILEKQRSKFSLKTVKIPRLVAYEILNISLPCFFAFLFTIPVSAYSFGYVSPYSPITNLILAPVLPVTLAFSLLSAIFCLTPFAFIYKPLLFISKILISLVCFVAKFFGNLPYSRLYLDGELIIPISVVIVALFLIAVYSKNPRGNSLKAALLVVPIICSAFISHNIAFSNYTKIDLLDTSTAIIEHNGKRIISGFSKGSTYEINRIISKSPSKSTLFLSSHSDNDSDISELTHFILSNDIKAVSASEKFTSAVETINLENVTEGVYSANDFRLTSNDIKLRSLSSEGGNVDLIDIGGFVIARLNVEGASDLPSEFECHLLIANSSSLPFIDRYKCRYFVLSEPLENREHISKYLAQWQITYVGDCNAKIALKDGKLVKKNDFTNQINTLFNL